MYHLKIQSAPQIISAHSMGSTTFRSQIPVSSGILELCYVSAGSIPVKYGDEFVLQKKISRFRQSACTHYDGGRPTLSYPQQRGCQNGF